ncbi:MAG: RNA polymerase sigma factor [Candidatus Eisenbacteria bacterium]|uniref:RNA polymerase sigma factor n=1 Tax=Eiseniibacteriota bacterium TaxID=2212470 RepID=A0A956NBW0_UNCEI|nr:RNA polymerase sigma factor [Candidatus Eisenbacteria bacterium]MCB9465408.1 RNA polymerase sigma factor [Candidatus Eisenbacteria bacterium]
MDDSSDRDDALLARSREGDSRALAMLYRRHASSLLEYLTRLVGEPSDAEDLLQETFLTIMERRGSYSARGRFRPWLFTVARHLAVDRLRRRRRGLDLAEDDLDFLVSPRSIDPTETISFQELTGQIDSALLDLPPSYALAFHLRVRESFSYREIAMIHGEPEGTLRSRVHHALRKVREFLDSDRTFTESSGPGCSGVTQEKQR